MMVLKPPDLILDMIAVWAAFTGLIGFFANGLAICTFCFSRKVNCLGCLFGGKNHILFTAENSF